MPLYRFRMKGVGGERRSGMIMVPEKDLVAAVLEEREAEYTAYELPEEEVDEIRRLEKEHEPVKGALKAHRVLDTQGKPYKLVKVEEA